MFESNAYVVVSRRVCVIDPGVDVSRVLGELRERGLGLDYIVNTHCHFDHVAADGKILRETGAKLLVHELDAKPLEAGLSEFVLSDFFGGDFKRTHVDVKLKDGSEVELGGITLSVLHTPGHTKGSICLLDEQSKTLFSGDTVFAGGVGRTDFPGGDSEELKSSVSRLSELVREKKIVRVYPGHGKACSGGDILRVRGLFL